jgi:hypothetical protein
LNRRPSLTGIGVRMHPNGGAWLTYFREGNSTPIDSNYGISNSNANTNQINSSNTNINNNNNNNSNTISNTNINNNNNNNIINNNSNNVNSNIINFNEYNSNISNFNNNDSSGFMYYGWNSYDLNFNFFSLNWIIENFNIEFIYVLVAIVGIILAMYSELKIKSYPWNRSVLPVAGRGSWKVKNYDQYVLIKDTKLIKGISNIPNKPKQRKEMGIKNTIKGAPQEYKNSSLIKVDRMHRF